MILIGCINLIRTTRKNHVSIYAKLAHSNFSLSSVNFDKTNLSFRNFSKAKNVNHKHNPQKLDEL